MLAATPVELCCNRRDGIRAHCPRRYRLNLRSQRPRVPLHTRLRCACVIWLCVVQDTARAVSGQKSASDAEKERRNSSSADRIMKFWLRTDAKFLRANSKPLLV